MSVNITAEQVAQLFDADNNPLFVVLDGNANQIWMLIAGFLVFFMHAGFSMLEAGSVRHRNAVNIMFKNMATMGIGGICWFLFGYAWAFGEDNRGESFAPYLSIGQFAFKDIGDRAFGFFQLAFAATAATIVSGAVAGRIHLIGYMIITAYLTAWVYPVVAHGIWYTGGWLGAFQNEGEEANVFFSQGGIGFVDFAGSGVVHLSGAVAAFWGALIVGPRLGRFENPSEFAPHNVGLQTLGTFILWFGWYGFNCGSTLAFDGAGAATVAVTTTLAPCGAVVVGIIATKLLYGHFDIGVVLNCALAGLVSITGPCGTTDDGFAIVIGMIGALVYMGSSKLMKIIKIDDPVDAISVHGACGIWGVLAVAIFFNDYSDGNSFGLQLKTQLVGLFFIISWMTVWMVPLLLVLKKFSLLRVSQEEEEAGLDASEHGGTAAFVKEDGKVAAAL
jgi:Amt family ammonium transporter